MHSIYMSDGHNLDKSSFNKILLVGMPNNIFVLSLKKGNLNNLDYYAVLYLRIPTQITNFTL